MNVNIHLKTGAAINVRNITTIKEIFTDQKEFEDFSSFSFRDGYFYIFIGENIASLNGTDILYLSFYC